MCWVTNQFGSGSSADLAVRNGHREEARVWSFATPSPKGRRDPFQPRGREQGEDRKPQLVQVTGSSRRDWRWLSRGARRRGQYLAGCEPVCGGITCSGRQDAFPASVRSPTVVLLCGLLGVEGMITHPVRCCSVPPTLCRELSTPPVHGAQQMDVHPVRRVRHVVSAPHTPRSVPRLPWSSSFLCCGIALLTDPFVIEPPAGQSQQKARHTPFLAASLLLCLAPSLTAALPRRRAALSPRPSVRPSVHPSLPPSLPPYLPLSPPLPPASLPPSLPPSLPLSLPSLSISTPHF